MSMSTPRPQLSNYEPDWRWVEKHSTLDMGRYGFVAFKCHYAYKAADNRDANLDYQWCSDWEEAFSAGYLLHDPWSGEVFTQEKYEDMTDPDYGKDPVCLGPYMMDQNDNGYFTYQGPEVYDPGPRPHWQWKPAGCTEEYWWDESLMFSHLQPYTFIPL